MTKPPRFLLSLLLLAGSAAAQALPLSCTQLAGLAIPATAIALPTSGGAVVSASVVAEHCLVLGKVSALDPAAPERRTRMFRGRERHFWVWPHERHYIWGATAAILVHLAARLRSQNR